MDNILTLTAKLKRKRSWKRKEENQTPEMSSWGSSGTRIITLTARKGRKTYYTLEKRINLVQHAYENFVCGEGYETKHEYLPDLNSATYRLEMETVLGCRICTTEYAPKAKSPEERVLAELFEYLTPQSPPL